MVSLTIFVPADCIWGSHQGFFLAALVQAVPIVIPHARVNVSRFLKYRRLHRDLELEGSPRRHFLKIVAGGVVGVWKRRRSVDPGGFWELRSHSNDTGVWIGMLKWWLLIDLAGLTGLPLINQLRQHATRSNLLLTLPLHRVITPLLYLSITIVLLLAATHTIHRQLGAGWLLLNSVELALPKWFFRRGICWRE